MRSRRGRLAIPQMTGGPAVSAGPLGFTAGPSLRGASPARVKVPYAVTDGLERPIFAP